MLARAFIATAALAAALPLAASAQTVQHQRNLQRTVPAASRTSVATNGKFRRIPIGPHTFYGRIESLNGNMLVVRTRTQRLITVDATDVLAAGTYSAPLFVGKLVTVDGNQPASGAFIAAHISRLTNLNSLRRDD